MIDIYTHKRWCNHCNDHVDVATHAESCSFAALKEENQRLRDALLYLSNERFCTPHMRVKIFSALNPDK